MTLEELAALPELGGIGSREEIMNGKVVRVPYTLPTGALFQKEDDPLSIVDAEGRRWMVGWMNGVRYKCRMRDAP